MLLGSSLGQTPTKAKSVLTLLDAFAFNERSHTFTRGPEKAQKPGPGAQKRGLPSARASGRPQQKARKVFTLLDAFPLYRTLSSFNCFSRVPVKVQKPRSPEKAHNRHGVQKRLGKGPGPRKGPREGLKDRGGPEEAKNPAKGRVRKCPEGRKPEKHFK